MVLSTLKLSSAKSFPKIPSASDEASVFCFHLQQKSGSDRIWFGLGLNSVRNDILTFYFFLSEFLLLLVKMQEGEWHAYKFYLYFSFIT